VNALGHLCSRAIRVHIPAKSSTEVECQLMQTILKVVCGNRGPYQMIEDLAAAFSSRFDTE